MLAITLSWCGNAVGDDSSPCPQWVVKGRIEPDLDSVEKYLVCGDTESKQHNGAWTQIPFTQARYHLKVFLQNRGYHAPDFKILSGSRYELTVGPRSKITRVDVLDQDGLNVDVAKMRLILGQPLTPEFLNQIETWIEQKIKAQGLACIRSETEADPVSGVVKVHIYRRLNGDSSRKARLLPSESDLLKSVVTDSIENTSEGVLRRYDAFQVGEPFDGRTLLLTEKRVQASGVVESSEFSISCGKGSVDLKQNVVPGRPHVLIAGAGLNTEGVLVGRFSWKNTRLGRNASLLNLSFDGSAKTQILQAALSWYFLDHPSRYFFNPVVQLNHGNEQPWENISLIQQIGLGGRFDSQRFGVGGGFFLGPSLGFFRALRGIGLQSGHYLFLENRLKVESFRHEYTNINGLTGPVSGYLFDVLIDFSSQGVYSESTLQRFQLSGEFLWNLGEYDPPLWVLGIRAGFGSVLTNELPVSGTRIPAPFLQYLGGSSNLRGFGRLELPVNLDAGGALTSSFIGSELRLSHTLPFNIDPFLFLDVGILGRASFSFDLPLYLSPGIGLRWASPIGPVRTTLAHGFTNESVGHLQFYLSLGEEF